ncbi:MAG: sigma-70 family RNA polymerase sigma factor [Candidatus Baltobacteraceae bacterium]
MTDPQALSPETFESSLHELRPKLHRYCARLTGSVIDGEDVVQEALAKAFAAFPTSGTIANVQSWLFRIAHNAALDFLRRRQREQALLSEEDLETIVDPSDDQSRLAVAAGMRTFMRLPVAQRSSVILMDVLGYSLQEIASITAVSVPAVKSALHRGRTRLRAIAHEPEEVAVPDLAPRERIRLRAYVERFNAYDFDSVRDMLADDVRLEVVDIAHMNGRQEVGRYFTNYARLRNWLLMPGLVEGRTAALVAQADDPRRRAVYFVLIGWSGDRVVTMRDFRHARYAIEGADYVVLDDSVKCSNADN